MANTHVILCIIVLKFQTSNKEEERKKKNQENEELD